ncbi:MAG: SusC/RagA family TonB-linked outer membrane protein, partial [Bacteroidota bacterium]
MKNHFFYKKWVKKHLTLATFLTLFLGLSAQQLDISGSVIDESGNPIIGGTVLLEGTGVGTVTDVEGNYSIQAEKEQVLIFSYTGYEPQKVEIGDNTTINIQLEFSPESLEEIVVTGYTTDRRRNISGSVSTIKAIELAVVPSGNVEQQLQGRVAGVSVISNGQPGTLSQVRIRGYGALRGNNPLYVVDGVPTTNVDFLNPEDIETVTVLKDATSASIYGARAASGVVVYTTKKGKKGRPLKVTYDGVFGVRDPGTGAPIMNPQDHADWTWKAIENAAIQAGERPRFQHPQFGNGDRPILPDYLLVGSERAVLGTVDLADHVDLYNVDARLGNVYQVIRAATGEGTDWYDAITRDAFMQRHSLNFSGGGEKSRYYLGLGAQEEEGILLHQKFSRYTLRLNTEFDVTPWLSIGENIQYLYRSANNLLGDGEGLGSSDDENVVLSASRMASIIPVFDEVGGYAGTIVGGFNNPNNPVATLDGRRDNRRFTTAILGNIYLQAQPIENLTLRSSFGGSYGSSHNWAFSRRQYENSENQLSFGFGQGSSFGYNWTFTNTASYKFNVGEKSKFNVLVGQEALLIDVGRGMNSSGINPEVEDIDFIQLNTINDRQAFGGHGNGITFNSYFGRMKYDFNDKYILTALVRRDGSSRFGAESRYGVFPAFSAAWRLSSENFLKDVSFLDDLKLRAGYGIMGNSNNVDPNNQFSLFGTSLDNSSYDLGGSNTGATLGFFRTRIGNRQAQWERAITSNVGVDALFFDGRLDIGVEFWQKDTEDLLFQKPLPAQTGRDASVPSLNVGKMRNVGIDLKIANKGTIADALRYEVEINGGFLRNEIVELAEGIENLPNASQAYRGIVPILNQVGQPLSAFYGYEVLGLFGSLEEVENAPIQEGAAPGRFRFADLNGFDEEGNLTGVPDGIIDEADRTTIGNPIPDFTGGLTIKLNYQNFGLEMYSYVSLGNEVYNISRLFTDFYSLFPGAAISERVKDSWSFENPTGEIPIFENVSNFSTNTQSNSFYGEDGSYFRIQNLSFYYSLPNRIT